MVDPSAQRIDLPLGNGLILSLTGEEGTFGVRMLREERDGRRTFVTAPTVLTEAEVASIAQLMRVFARNHRRETPWVGEDEEQEGAALAQSVAATLG